MANPETVVRKYLDALRDPSSLRDDEAIGDVERKLADEGDPIARLKLQQELAELNAPSMDSIENAFVVSAKAWADDIGITGKAFAAEGVPAATLRRAGFAVSGRGGKRTTSSGGGKKRGSRVTTEMVIDAMPQGAFTLRSLRELTGASPAVVRKAVTSEEEAGRVVDAGPDPDHSGPGRAATLYRKK